MLLSFASRSSQHTQLMLGVFLMFLVLCIYRLEQSLPAVTPRSKPTTDCSFTRLRSKDQWVPSQDWNGHTPIYDNFPSANEDFASGSTMQFDQRDDFLPQPQPFPKHQTLDAENLPVSCVGPRGLHLDRSDIDQIWRYKSTSQAFAAPSFGSAEVVGFESNACYDRFGRHHAYGLEVNRTLQSEVTWDMINWAELQARCYESNKQRFNVPNWSLFEDGVISTKSRLLSRTAVVLRFHQHAQYTEDVKRNIRSIIQELALYSGSQYAVFLLVEVKDEDKHIWDDTTVYENAIREIVPAEFQNITVLWSMYMWHKKYSMIPEEMLGVHLSQWLPLQYFQKLYPGFEYYWNWEMDVRYIGHYHDLVETVENFTRAQPRKGLWERNSRLYIPRVHGSFENFRDSVQSRYIHEGRDLSVWGPQFPRGRPSYAQALWRARLHTEPPVPSPDLDLFDWGVGEQADFVTFLPMFNPELTNYVHRNAVTNYDSDIKSYHLPRRTTIITFARISSRLLQLMEAENITPPMHHISSESWPHSLSLQYGLKAVSVPHAIYLEQNWPGQALDFIFNNGDQESIITQYDHMDPQGEGSGGPESTFGLEREHNWDRSTWYYRNRLAERLYKRWLGWEIDGIGGQDWEQRNGLYCLPPMLLHPVKTVTSPGDSSA